MNKLKKCLFCNKAFERPFRSKNSKFKISWNNYKKRIFCSASCHWQWFSKNVRGENHPLFKNRRKYCIDCKKLIYYYSAGVRCRDCWKLFLKNPINHPSWKGGFPKCLICGNKTGDYHSKICRKCYRGKYHPFWNGGTSSLSALIRKLPKYRNWAVLVFKRDKFICQKCGDTGLHKNNNLCPHHIKPFIKILKDNKIKSLNGAIKCEEFWDVSNGITLCRKCHKKTNSFSHKFTQRRF